MKLILYFLLFTLVASCSIKEGSHNIDGDWLILSMTYDGQEIYPKNKTQNIRFEIEGYSDFQELHFNKNDLTLIAPVSIVKK
jgi:hypothetical protein